MAKGFVYILTSPNCPCVKIGRTDTPPMKRLREINSNPEYRTLGPWNLSDFLHVVDSHLVERRMHQHFGAANSKDYDRIRELFRVTPFDARQQLQAVEPALRVGSDDTVRLTKDRDIEQYLLRLFAVSGLFGNLDIQGAWTLTLFTSTADGRTFTINIGTHEVAFSGLTDDENVTHHYIVMDALILRYPDVKRWLKARGGTIKDAPHKTARQGAVVLFFEDRFADAQAVFDLPGVRRAIIAYWADWLAEMRAKGTKSWFERYHNYDVTYKLLELRRAWDAVFLPPPSLSAEV